MHRFTLTLISASLLSCCSSLALAADDYVSFSMANVPNQSIVGRTYDNVQFVAKNITSSAFVLNNLFNTQLPNGFTQTSNSCSGVVLQPGGTCAITGTFSPSNAGQYTWSTQVAANNYKLSKVYSASVDSSYIIVVPEATNHILTVWTGSTAKGHITIKNDSSEAIKPGLPTVNVNNPHGQLKTADLNIQAGSCTGDLAPLASCSYNLTYTAHSAVGGSGLSNGVATLTIPYIASGDKLSITHTMTLVQSDLGSFQPMPLNQVASVGGTMSDNIHSVTTKGKYVYLGTGAGLSISDDYGKTYRTITVLNGLGSNTVFSVAVGNDGTVYAGTNHGLSISTNGGLTFANRTSKNGLGGYYINSIAVDSSGTIYAATNGGLSISTDGGKTFKNYTKEKNNLDSNDVQGIAVDSAGTIYAATNNGLSISTDGGKTFNNYTKEKNNLGSNNVQGIAVDSSGTIYAATYNGLSISTDGGKTFKNYTKETNNLGSNNVQGVAVDSAGTIYAATDNGISRKSIRGDQKFTNTLTSTGTSISYLRNMAVDGNGNIYTASDYHLYVSTDAGATFDNRTPSNLPGNGIKTIAVGPQDQIYMAAQDGVLQVSKDQGASFSKISSNHLKGSIYDIIVDDAGTIYVATDKGLGISTDHGENFTIYTAKNNGLASDHVNGITVATFAGTKYIYAATNSGLSISSDNGQHFTTYTITNGLGSNTVNSVGVDSNRVIYAGTAQGFSISTDGGTIFKNYSKIDGLLLTLIKNVSVDPSGVVYASSNSGLIVTTIGKDGTPHFTLKTSANGFTDGYAFQSAIYKNNVYVATSAGISYSKTSN